ncbi:MAG: ComEC/Rec2 family competence protein [Rikenellaceae bacterium]
MQLFELIPFLALTLPLIIGVMAKQWGFVSLVLLLIPKIRKYWIYIAVVCAGSSIKLISDYSASLPINQSSQLIAVVEKQYTNYDVVKILSKAPHTKIVLDKYQRVNIGDTLSATIYIEAINKYKIDNKSIFKSESLQGTKYIGFIDTSQPIHLKAATPKHSFINNLRDSIESKISQTSLKTQDKAIVKAMMIGDKSSISSKTFKLYRQAGVMHTLAVSGMHVGVIFLMLSLLLKFMNISRNLRVIRSVIIIATLTIYALVCNLSPSVVRSVMMFSLYQVTSHFITNRYHSYNILLLCAFIMIAIEPNIIWNISFQLSFLAMGAIIYFADLSSYIWDKPKNRGEKLLKLLVISCGVSIATLPLSLYYFGQGSIISPISNMIMITLLPLIFISSTLLLTTGNWLIGKLVEIIFDTTNLALEALSSLDILYLQAIEIELSELIALYSSLAILAYYGIKFYICRK